MLLLDYILDFKQNKNFRLEENLGETAFLINKMNFGQIFTDIQKT